MDLVIETARSMERVRSWLFTPRGALWYFGVSYFLIAIAWGALAQPAPWVDQLKSTHGQLCCSNNDGRRLDDPDWDTLGKVQTDYTGTSGFRVYENGKWYDVPNWALVTERNRDGIARVWWDREYNAEGGTITKRIRCFIAGELG